MICFICKNTFSTLKSLVAHLKIFHLLKSYSTYECAEEFCHQAFQNLNSFKKHISTKHPTLNSNAQNCDSLTDNLHSVNAPQGSNITEIMDEFADTHAFKIQSTSIEIPDESLNLFDIDSSINFLYKLAIKFTMSLHNNNNFSFKDVLKIQNGIIDYLTKPMASMLMKLSQTQSDPVTKSKFNRLSTAFSNPFQSCVSEYRLKKWLVQNQYVTEIQQFTIHNELCSIHLNGETIYDEKSTKGALLPINEQFKKVLEHGDNLNIFINKLDLFKNDNSSISHFVQGNLWKQKISNFEGKIVFPFFFVRG